MTEQCSCGEYSHECQKEGACSCGCGCNCGCGCGDHHHHAHSHHEVGGHCHCAEKFLNIADEAWIEILKEKIKNKILEKKGEHLERLAEMVAMANGEKWKHIISARTKCTQFKDSLKDFFSSCE